MRYKLTQIVPRINIVIVHLDVSFEIVYIFIYIYVIS